MALLNLSKLKKKAKQLPNAPGVYIWKNKKGEPIYVGRAGSLKKRVASYFLKKREARIFEMVHAAHSLDHIKTDSLLEAIVLEANLIKQYWPKYNVKDRDNRSFVYLVILKETFPKPMIVRGRDIGKYVQADIEIFGPFQSYRLLRTALELIRPIFPFSTCTYVKKLPRPCFHHQIGLCPGVCINKVDVKEYKKSIRNLVLFFRGEKKLLLKKLKKENPEKIKALQHIEDTALLADSKTLEASAAVVSRRIEGYDISHLAGKDPVGAMVVFENGEKDVSQYRLFKIRGSQHAASARRTSMPTGRQVQVTSSDDLAMLEEVLERRLRHTEWPMPDIVFVDGGVNQVRRVAQVLARSHVQVPVVGLSKAGKHAGSAFSQDKMVIANARKVGKELIVSSKRLFQEVRNEAHRFAIGFQRRRSKRSFISKGWIR